MHSKPVLGREEVLPHDVGHAENIGARGDGGGSERKAPALHQLHRAAQRIRTDEGLVPLHVEDRLECAELGAPGDLRHSVGARGVIRIREHALGARCIRGVGHRGVVGSNDTALGDAER